MAKLQVTDAQEKEVKGIGFLRNKGTDEFSARVITINGKINAEQQRVIGDAAEKFGSGDVTFTSRLTIEIPGIHYDDIQAFRDYIAQADLETGGTGSKVRPVVSCKGTVCAHGLIDTFDISEKTHYEFYKGWRDVKLPHKFKIAFGGCPNNCVKPLTNDLGFVGASRPTYDYDACMGCKKCQPQEACPIADLAIVRDETGKMRITDECNDCGKCIGVCPFDAIGQGPHGVQGYVGGMFGKRRKEAVPMGDILETEEDVKEYIERVILFYREQGNTGERLAQTVNRIGEKESEEILLSDELYARKQEILDASLHEEGGATC